MNKIEQDELQAAEYVHRCAVSAALLYCRPDDHTEVAAAILIRALELATPDLSPERRASLFFMEQ